jgi:hypothetical protein
MTQPTLNYESPPPNRPTALRTATWIVLLVFGYLLCLGGTCAGLMFLALPQFRSSAARPPSALWLSAIETVVYLAATSGTGITYILTSNGIRRFSRRSARIALTMTLVNIALIFALFTLDTVQIPPPVELISNKTLLTFGILWSLTDAILAFCLYRILREPKSEDAK